MLWSLDQENVWAVVPYLRTASGISCFCGETGEKKIWSQSGTLQSDLVCEGESNRTAILSLIESPSLKHWTAPMSYKYVTYESIYMRNDRLQGSVKTKKCNVENQSWWSEAGRAAKNFWETSARSPEKSPPATSHGVQWLIQRKWLKLCSTCTCLLARWPKSY